MAGEQQATGSSGSDKGVSVATFWILILIGVAAWFFYEAEADVLMDVSTQPELVTGMVTFAGAPVRSGVVHVVVYDAGTRRYLAGMSLPLSDTGKFTSQGSSKFAVEEHSHPSNASKVRPLRIAATFYGTRGDEKSATKTRPLAGESTLYINSSPPLGKRFLWSIGTIIVVLLAFQLWVFTGELGQGKARTLFILMYFFTFLALALPLVVSLIVAQNKYLVDSMENSPLGLIKAKTSALAEPQWLINIGGTVKPAGIGKRADDDTTTKMANAAGAATGVGTPSETNAETDDTGLTIQGGVTVPFFMVLLAVFGAGINMTLKVPAIQRAYEDVLSDARSAPWTNPLMATWRLLRGQARAQAPESVVVPRKTAGDIRRDLIENYMYLLSAPLLAIAMYYLLQVMAAQVTQPVLVLMALATGLVSKAVIGGIIDFAETKLLSAKRRDGRAVADANSSIAATVEDASTKQLEAEASQQALDEAREKEIRAQAFAQAAEATARNATQEQAEVETAIARGEATPAEAEAANARVDEATREAAAKKVQAVHAGAQAQRAANEMSTKRSEAQAAVTAMQDATARQAAAQSEAMASAALEAKDKQSEALAAAETTQEAAKVATEKQEEAAAAMEAVQPSATAAQADAAVSAAKVDAASDKGGAVEPTKKD